MCNMKALSLLLLKLWPRLTFFVHAANAKTDVDTNTRALTLDIPDLLNMYFSKGGQTLRSRSKDKRHCFGLVYLLFNVTVDDISDI